MVYHQYSTVYSLWKMNNEGKCIHQNQIFMIPVRCFTCRKVISNKVEDYENFLKEGQSVKEALDLIGMYRPCCRRMFITAVDLTPIMSQYIEGSKSSIPRIPTVISGHYHHGHKKSLGSLKSLGNLESLSTKIQTKPTETVLQKPTVPQTQSFPITTPNPIESQQAPKRQKILRSIVSNL